MQNLTINTKNGHNRSVQERVVENMHQSHGPGTLQKLHNMHPNISKQPQKGKKSLIQQLENVKMKVNALAQKKKANKGRERKVKEVKVMN